MIMARTCCSRPAAKNMCSVRQSTIPAAPFEMAASASTGVSALARALQLFTPAAHREADRARDETRWPDVAEAPQQRRGQCCHPARSSLPDQKYGVPMRTRPVPASIEMSRAPGNAALPMPRATTAAWLVAPPRFMRKPTEASMPWISSAVVSSVMRMTASPFACIVTAAFADGASLTTAAPGEAGSPVTRTVSAAWEEVSSETDQVQSNPKLYQFECCM